MNMKLQRNLPIKPIEDIETATAFIVGLIFNQNQKAEQAWSAPYLLQERLQTLAPSEILRLPQQRLVNAINRPSFLHPFSDRMARHIWHTCTILVEKYEGNPRRVWEPVQPMGVVLKRLHEFPGIGKHKAVVGVYVLKNVLNVPMLHDGTKLNVRTACPNLFSIVGVDE